MSQKITGRITNYRIGIRAQQPKECLIEFNNINLGAAGQLIGKKVVWSHNKMMRTGRIVGLHGNKGTVRVKFAKPVSGQAIGTTVELVA